MISQNSVIQDLKSLEERKKLFGLELTKATGSQKPRVENPQNIGLWRQRAIDDQRARLEDRYPAHVILKMLANQPLEKTAKSDRERAKESADSELYNTLLRSLTFAEKQMLSNKNSFDRQVYLFNKLSRQYGELEITDEVLSGNLLTEEVINFLLFEKVKLPRDHVTIANNLNSPESIAQLRDAAKFPHLFILGTAEIVGGVARPGGHWLAVLVTHDGSEKSYFIANSLKPDYGSNITLPLKPEIEQLLKAREGQDVLDQIKQQLYPKAKQIFEEQLDILMPLIDQGDDYVSLFFNVYTNYQNLVGQGVKQKYRTLYERLAQEAAY